MTIQTNIAELITAFYDEFLEIYGDEDMAAVATAATINDMLIAEAAPVAQEEAA